jgi:glycosyltransferase involved in cell wall biosynthesis
MKVLIIYWGKRGGGCLYTYELSKSLINNGVNVYFSLSLENQISDKFKALNRPIFEINTFNNINEFFLNSFNINSIKIKLLKYINENKIDIILCGMHHVWTPFIFPFIIKKNIPIVLVVHDALIHPGDGAIIHQPLLNHSIKNSTAYIILSESVKEVFINKFGNKKKIGLIPHGAFNYNIEDTKHKKIIDLNKSRITFFGRISHYKGIDILLDSWGIVHKSFPEAKLNIYGEGDLSKYVKKIESYPSINYTNRWISEAEISEIFEKTDLVVLPYLEASQSGVIGIAHSNSIPVVVTPLKGLINQLQFGGGVISEYIDSNSFASSIISVLNNRTHYDELCKQASFSSKQYNWNTISLNVKKFLYDVLINK